MKALWKGLLTTIWPMLGLSVAIYFVTLAAHWLAMPRTGAVLAWGGEEVPYYGGILLGAFSRKRHKSP